MNPHIRLMHRSDIYRVLDIESMCFEFSWTEDEILSTMSRRSRYGMVAEHEDTTLGFMFFEITKGRMNLLDFAVHPIFQRQGVGVAMVERLKSTLRNQRLGQQIMLDIRETNMDGLMFFKSQGFKALRTLKNYYEETDEDAILMQYTLPQAAVVASLPVLPETRMRR